MVDIAHASFGHDRWKRHVVRLDGHRVKPLCLKGHADHRGCTGSEVAVKEPAATTDAVPAHVETYDRNKQGVGFYRFAVAWHWDPVAAVAQRVVGMPCHVRHGEVVEVVLHGRQSNRLPACAHEIDERLQVGLAVMGDKHANRGRLNRYN